MNIKNLKLLLILGLLFAAPVSAKEPINVFACEPEWAALAEEVGGPFVSAFSATHAKQDPHHIRARPSLISKMRRSDLVLCSGASLEVGWLPVLLQKAGNTSVQPGGPNHLLAADFVPLLETLTEFDRSMGDVHPEGNPHVHLNPHNLFKIADVLSQRLQQLDPSNATKIAAQHDDFVERWHNAITRWEAQAEPLKGMTIISHHKSLSYLVDWLGLNQIATLESKPGIPPNTAHLQDLLQTIKHQPVSAIVRTPYDPSKASEWLAKRSKIPMIVLPYTVGRDEESGDLFALFERTLALFIENGS